MAVIGTGWWATTAHIPALQACPHAEFVALRDTVELLEAAYHFAAHDGHPVATGGDAP